MNPSTVPPNDSHDFTPYDPFTNSLQQRQQQTDTFLGPRIFSRLSISSESSQHSRSPGPDPTFRVPENPSFALGPTESQSRPQQTVRFVDEEPSSRYFDPSAAISATAAQSPSPHPALQISPRTSSAILSAVEALRSPFQFTPDLVEEGSQMSDLPGRASNGGARAGGPVPVQQSSKMITPTDIMRKRREKEEAKQQAAEAERLATRRRPGDDLTDPSQAAGVAGPGPSSQSAHRRSQSSAQPGGRSSDPSAAYVTGTAPGAGSPQLGNSQNQSAQNPAISSRTRANTQPAQPRPISSTTANPGQQYSTQAGPSSSSQARPSAAAGPSRPRPSQAAGAQPSSGSGNVSSFPHAFERWETLSSHWEGLTSYWIRRLEQNGEELRREPLLQQLSRQVTDLSAAGANLFHAVVELQRLRQSSERKFNHWFHETRKEAERQQEISAQLENALVQERQARAQDIQRMEAILIESQSSRGAFEKNAKLNEESKRELQIAKDEARRAWEELGRREQEERERTAALREGQPILIGGIQVFPTAHQSSRNQHMAGISSSSADRPLTRDGSSAPPPMSGQPVGEDPNQPSPTTTDPFMEHQHQHLSHEHAVLQPPTTNGIHSSPGQPSAIRTTASPPTFYQHPTSFLHSEAQANANAPATSGASDAPSYVHSEEAFSSEHDEEDYEYDEHGQIRRDGVGRPIIHRRGHNLTDEDDDLDINDELEREARLLEQYGSAVQYPPVPAPTSTYVNAIPSVAGPSRPPGSSAPPAEGHQVASASAYSNLPPADYEGKDYEDGAFDTWDRINHFHSRLSEIPEQDEDERSRISEQSAKRARRGGPF